MTREETRQEINGRPLTDFYPLQRSPKAGRNMYVCPLCGSGTGAKGTGGFHIYPDSKRNVCYSCLRFNGKSGEDNLGFLRIVWNCSENEVFERCGYKESTPAPVRTDPKQKEERKETSPADYSLFYRECHEALKKSPEAMAYLKNRGITEESIDRFNLGYCAAWKHSKAGDIVKPSKRIIIPRTAGTYTARNIEEPKDEYEKGYTKQLQGTQKDLFNLEGINGKTPIICEGELDAISLYQAGASSVVAIGTIANIAEVLTEAKKHPEAVFILALDNDKDKENGSNPGKDAQKKLAADMKEAGLCVLNVYPPDIYGEAKDGNEAFIKDPERLGRKIALIEAKAGEMWEAKDTERKKELRQRTGEGMLDDFILKVTDTEKRPFEPIKTGISDIDRALNGGLMRKTLVMLGAAPGMGKTALSQWIFENMATAGNDCLYINLEMSREQLLARSLSRIAWKNEKKDISAIDILRGYSWNDEQWGIVGKAVAKYKEDIAPHFIYNPDGVGNSLASILAAMESETRRLQNQGKAAPLICIDYLQLIDSGNRDNVEGMKNTIAAFKQFALVNNTVVFLIMANNRESNKEGKATLESGRDTSAIEYSGDMVLGLSYTAIEDKEKYTIEENGKKKTCVYDLDAIRELKRAAYEKGEPTPAICNGLSLRVLKNRFGDSERRAKLLFDGKHATFYLIEQPFKTYSGKTPF